MKSGTGRGTARGTGTGKGTEIKIGAPGRGRKGLK